MSSVLRNTLVILTATGFTLSCGVSRVLGCTGITLKAKDGAVVYGRTAEWGPFDLKARVVIVPRNYESVGHTPDKKTGLKWKSKYGMVGIECLDDTFLGDGLNEKGLTIGAFYHLGFAKYQQYDPKQAVKSLAPTDLAQYLLGTCATLKDVRDAIAQVRVVPTIEKSVGIPFPLHFIVTEPSGKAIVIEYLKGEPKIFDASLGVITNSPTYDWHLTNLRNYINLSAIGLPAKNVEDLKLKPLGAGSGMIGLPGDFTPPSRFIRAVAFAKSARETKTGQETIYEMFRILDNFNVPLGAAEGSDDNVEKKTEDLRSATQITTAIDTWNKVLYYHTQHNRRVRKVDLKKIDFTTLKKVIRFPVDNKKEQDIKDVTPTSK